MSKLISVIFSCLVSFLMAFDQCRWSGGLLNPNDFDTWSCSLCFVYIFPCKQCNNTRIIYSSKGLYTNDQISFNLFSNETKEEFTPDALAENSVICDQFLDGDGCEKWRNCCQTARDCCSNMQSIRGNFTGNCPMTWDGVDCWNHALPNTVQSHSCPSYFVVPALEPRNPTATKRCTNDSTWYRYKGRTEWTDYTHCLVQPNLRDILKASVYVHFVGYGLSLLALVAASTILIAVPSLRRDEQARYRFKLHMNLFTSFIVLDTLSIVMDSENYLKRLNDPTYHFSTTPCRVLTILHWYARGATYWWLFCEGLFLHRRLRNWAFADCPESLVKYYVTGWVFPALPVLTWMIIHLSNNDEGCWDASDDNLRFILLVPNLASLLLNFVMLLDIQRMIMTTVSQARNEPVVVIIRQGLRATISLIPLFGLQIILVIFRPKDLVEYDIFAALLVSTQGLLVACFYCLTKRETRHEIRRVLRQRQLLRASFSTSNATQSTRFSTNSVEDSRANSIGMTQVADMPAAKNGAKQQSVEV